jgi:hypothetical protein
MIEKLDARLALLEARIGARPLSFAPTPAKMSIVQSNNKKRPCKTQKRKRLFGHTRKTLIVSPKRTYKQRHGHRFGHAGRVKKNPKVISPKKRNISRFGHPIRSNTAIQEKAAHLNSLLTNMRSYVENNKAHTVAYASRTQPIQPKNCRKKYRRRARTTHSEKLPKRQRRSRKKKSPTVDKITIRKSRRWTNRRPKV